MMSRESIALYAQCAAGIGVIAAFMLLFSLYLQYAEYKRMADIANSACLRATYKPVEVKGEKVPGVGCTEAANTVTGEIVSVR